tara:strand:- start:203 stop:1480 length:1278 start_codon:yes stop_codon:yes gene_type:complete
MQIVGEKTQHSLTKEQKQAVGILSIGTFLEYFDLMLYVHMAVLLNELFFPKYDPHTQSLIAAFAFSSTFVMRPIGALIFGYMGDSIGRKTTVIITTLLMALSSFIMFILPTYAQIGITAAWLVTICRMVQGIASMGELIGASLYLSELIKSPRNYAPVAFVKVASMIGTVVALLVAILSIKLGVNWRYAFLIGSGVALVGVTARTALRETPEFIDASKRILYSGKINSEKVSTKVAISYFLLEMGYPIWTYVGYIHYGVLLKNDFGYSASDVIQHNLYIAFIALATAFVIMFLTTRIHPLKIMKIRATVFAIFLPILIYRLESDNIVINILILQVFIKAFNPATFPADAVIFPYFPVLKRFFSTAVLFSISRALMYVVTSFGTVYLTEYFGTYGLLVMITPVLIGYFYGLNTFIKLETEAGKYLK